MEFARRRGNSEAMACEERRARGCCQWTLAAVFEQHRWVGAVAGFGAGSVFGGAVFHGGDFDREVAEVDGRGKRNGRRKSKTNPRAARPATSSGAQTTRLPPTAAGRRTGCPRLAAQENRAEQESSHDPSAAARKRRGPSVGMTTFLELATRSVCRLGIWRRACGAGLRLGDSGADFRGRCRERRVHEDPIR